MSPALNHEDRAATSYSRITPILASDIALRAELVDEFSDTAFLVAELRMQHQRFMHWLSDDSELPF